MHIAGTVKPPEIAGVVVTKIKSRFTA
jgi:hypothetical protein